MKYLIAIALAFASNTILAEIITVPATVQLKEITQERTVFSITALDAIRERCAIQDFSTDSSHNARLMTQRASRQTVVTVNYDYFNDDFLGEDCSIRSISF
jgi:hypothetical protein